MWIRKAFAFSTGRKKRNEKVLYIARCMHCTYENGSQIITVLGKLECLSFSLLILSSFQFSVCGSELLSFFLRSPLLPSLLPSLLLSRRDCQVSSYNFLESLNESGLLVSIQEHRRLIHSLICSLSRKRRTVVRTYISLSTCIYVYHIYHAA